MIRMIPPKKICEEFRLTYELKGAQKAVDMLSRYNRIRRMKIVVDGRKVGNSDDACYYDYVAYFKKKGLNRRNVLHESIILLLFTTWIYRIAEKSEKLIDTLELCYKSEL